MVRNVEKDGVVYLLFVYSGLTKLINCERKWRISRIIVHLMNRGMLGAGE